MGYAKLDMHRQIRSGFPEVIFCSGKADAHLVPIVKRLYEANGEDLEPEHPSISTRCWKKFIPQIQYDPISHILKIENKEKKEGSRPDCCMYSGNSWYPGSGRSRTDGRIFWSKSRTDLWCGCGRYPSLFARLDAIQDANCVVAVAGMEGALASVLGGLVNKPVIAVPTSVGYGASMNGISALLTMINSCANGIATVNIDNGYGAGYIATQINRMGVKQK